MAMTAEDLIDSLEKDKNDIVVLANEMFSMCELFTGDVADAIKKEARALMYCVSEINKMIQSVVESGHIFYQIKYNNNLTSRTPDIANAQECILRITMLREKMKKYNAKELYLSHQVIVTGKDTVVNLQATYFEKQRNIVRNMGNSIRNLHYFT